MPSWLTRLRLTPWMIWWAIGVHIGWGLALLYSPEVVSRIVILVGLHQLIALGIPGPLLGAGLILFSVMAMVSLVFGDRLGNLPSLALLMPQYALVAMSLFSDLYSIHAGVLNSAGVPIDRFILLVVLWPVMLAALLHTAAIIERHIRWTG